MGEENMLIGRASELSYLNQYYQRQGSQILVVYGQKNIGKTELVREFMKDKPGHYHFAGACSEQEQLYQWSRQLKEEGVTQEMQTSFFAILQHAVGENTRKMVLVVDEFQNLVKAGNEFMDQLVSFLHREGEEAGVMVVLCSSMIGWVENSMVTRIGAAAYELSGFLKIKELPFACMEQRFPDFRVEECVETYAVLGGFPGLWDQFDDKLTVQQNLCRNVLDGTKLLFEEGERLVTEQLREPAVYNTILASLASGRKKLNDLYLHTGFSRAKISVYLKSLMELELVEKVFSYDTEGRENVQKGVYQICHPLVEFYFTYLYPNMSSRMTMSPGEFYNHYIMPDFRAYTEKAFERVCRQYLLQCSERNRLPFTIESIGEWVGKNGTIDLIAQDETGNTLAGICNWQEPVMTYEDYERLLRLAKKARIRTDYVYLFTATKFDERLHREARGRNDLKLVQISDMT